MCLRTTLPLSHATTNDSPVCSFKRGMWNVFEPADDPSGPITISPTIKAMLRIPIRTNPHTMCPPSKREPNYLSIDVGIHFLGSHGRVHGGVDGQVIVFFVMTVAAAEVAVGLAIIVAIFRARHRIDVDDLSLMRW